MKRVFALGISKGWVELREANGPPKLHITQLVKNIEQRVWKGYAEEYPHAALWAMKPRKLKIKIVTFAGGKTLVTIKSRAFASKTKIAVRLGGVYEVPVEMYERLGVGDEQTVKTT